jgi:hypothetical protein
MVATSCTAEDLRHLRNFAPTDNNRSSRGHSKKVGRRRIRRRGCLGCSGPCVINVYTCCRTLINRGGPRLSRLCHECLCAISMQTSRWNISSRVSPLLCLRPYPNRSLPEPMTRTLYRHFGNDVRFAGKCTVCHFRRSLHDREHCSTVSDSASDGWVLQSPLERAGQRCQRQLDCELVGVLQCRMALTTRSFIP